MAAKLQSSDLCFQCPPKVLSSFVRANALVILLTRVHAARRCPDKPAKAQASSVMARASKVSKELLHMRSLLRQTTTNLCAMQAGWI